MDETPPSTPPDDSAAKNEQSYSATKPDNYTAPVSGGGCAFVAGVIGGFILFVIAGVALLGASQSGALGTVYLFGAAGTAVWLATKPGCRGLALGIFLGLGAFLLLLAICSGKGF